jgi:flavin reductase (DIM6/NTAB) family NADH-FMN oxidoreductase RutF
VSPEAFRNALARWASGVTVITAREDDGPVGMTAASFSSLSLDPPLILVCIAHSARSHHTLTTAEGFIVHVLSHEQQHFSRRFSTPGSKFEDLETGEGLFGAPLLPLGTARLECERYAALEGGDHTILIGRVRSAESTEAEPLVYWDRSYRGVTNVAD